jgi:hypothetical protein
LKTDIAPFFAVTDYSLDECAFETGAFFLLLLLAGLSLVDKVRGKPRKLPKWALFRKLEIFKYSKRNPSSVMTILNISNYYYLIMPVLMLLGWTALIVYDRLKDELSLLPVLCLTMVSVSMMILGFNVLRIKWSNYRLKRINVLLMVFVILMMAGY